MQCKKKQWTAKEIREKLIQIKRLFGEGLDFSTYEHWRVTQEDPEVYPSVRVIHQLSSRQIQMIYDRIFDSETVDRRTHWTLQRIEQMLGPILNELPKNPTVEDYHRWRLQQGEAAQTYPSAMVIRQMNQKRRDLISLMYFPGSANLESKRFEQVVMSLESAYSHFNEPFTLNEYEKWRQLQIGEGIRYASVPLIRQFETEYAVSLLGVYLKETKTYTYWNYTSICQKIEKVLSDYPMIQTLTQYESWRMTQGEQRDQYPSEATIRRLPHEQLGEIQHLFGGMNVCRKRKWTQERVMSVLKRAYLELSEQNLTFTPKNYKQWQALQVYETPKYSTISELVGSFKEVRQQLKIEDPRFAQDSNRPKLWTEEVIWTFLKQAYRDLTRQEVDFTQQAFIQWRTEQVEQNVRVPALSTIKTVLGGGGFARWKEVLISQMG